ncbi:MAG: hypothetical protein HDR43_00640 [Mycoplasma sp.]|nr:hypothetical protein [Mycoplasma sp.]
MKIYKWYELRCDCGNTDNLNNVVSNTRDIKIMCKQCILKEIEKDTYCNNCLKITKHIHNISNVENGFGSDYIVDNKKMICSICNK